MAYTLGATLEVNEKEGRFIINGNHNKEDLCKILDDFIEKYVLCGKCKNPETVMTIAKTRESIRAPHRRAVPFRYPRPHSLGHYADAARESHAPGISDAR